MSTPTCTCPGGSPLLAAGLDLPCPCTYHRRFAELYAADPRTWGPKMVESARFRAGLPRENPVGPASRARTDGPFPSRGRPRRAGEPVRIGLLTPCIYLGGAEIWLAELIAHTDRSRVEWVGVASRHRDAIDPGMVDRLRGLGVVVRHDEHAVEELAPSCDVLLCWGFDPYAESPAAVAGRPLVLISHGIGEWTAKGMRSASRASALVAVSRAAVAPFPEDQRTRVRVIRNGIDPSRVVPSPGGRARVRAEWGVPPDRHLCLYLGRVSPEKNPRAFLEASSGCESHWPGRFRFVAVGGGLDLAAERAWASEHAPAALMTGPRADVADCLAAADTLILPSHEEACSLSMLEAMTAGVPVLATPVGHMADPAYANLARLLPPSPTGADIADALGLDLSEYGFPARHERIGLAMQAMAGFTAGRMAAEYAELIESVAPPVPAREPYCPTHTLPTWEPHAPNPPLAREPCGPPEKPRASPDEQAMVRACRFREDGDHG